MPQILATPEATTDWGRALAASLHAGNTIALCGHLGAGKTQAVKGIVAGLASKADVTSPTFTLVHEYLDGRIPIYHFDFYRMQAPEEVLSLGWDDFLDEPGVVLVEWADLFPTLLPDSTRWFHLETTPEGQRQVQELSAPPSFA